MIWLCDSFSYTDALTRTSIACEDAVRICLKWPTFSSHDPLEKHLKILDFTRSLLPYRIVWLLGFLVGFLRAYGCLNWMGTNRRCSRRRRHVKGCLFRAILRLILAFFLAALIMWSSMVENEMSSFVVWSTQAEYIKSMVCTISKGIVLVTLFHLKRFTIQR